MKSFLYIEPYVYVTATELQGLLLNTINNEIFITHDKSIIEILNCLINSSWGYLIEISDENIIDNKFLQWLKQTFSGDVMSISDNKQLPLQLFPNFNKFKTSDLINLRLYNIVIYINSCCPQNCSLCGSFNKQTIFCKKKNTQEFISADKVKFFLNQIGYDRINSISFIGGDIINEKLKSFLDEFWDIDCEKNVYTNFLNVTEGNVKYVPIENYNLKILVSPEFDMLKLEESINLMHNIGVAYDIVKLINSIKDLENSLPFDNVNYIPFYDGNLDFFESNIYTVVEDLLEKKISLQELYNNHNFNSLFWGTFIIDSNYDAYISFAKSPIGNIRTRESIEHLFKLCYDEDSLWRLLRKNVKPCNACAFNLLCPPISNYELEIGKFNLCSICND